MALPLPYDLTGRLVMQRTYTDEISLSGLHDGLYLLNVTTAGGTIITQKFMVRQ